MVPFRNTNRNAAKIAFNTSLCRLRVGSEQAFGIFKKVFYSVHDELRLSPGNFALLFILCVAPKLFHNETS